MHTKHVALGMVIGGLLLGVGLTSYRAAACGLDKDCDEYWNTAALTASGAVGMGWAWLTQAPIDRPRKPQAPPRKQP